VCSNKFYEPGKWRSKRKRGKIFFCFLRIDVKERKPESKISSGNKEDEEGVKN